MKVEIKVETANVYLSDTRIPLAYRGEGANDLVRSISRNARESRESGGKPTR